MKPAVFWATGTSWQIAKIQCELFNIALHAHEVGDKEGEALVKKLEEAAQALQVHCTKKLER